MSIMGETVATVEKYPWWIAGGVVALLAAWWLFTPSGTSNAKGGAPQNFTFSYGPSDANIAAGTQLAMQQAKDQTDVSVATLNADLNRDVAGDYFGYLTTHSADNLQAQMATLQTQGSTASQQIAAQQQAAQLQYQTNQASIAAGTTRTGISASEAENLAAIQAQSQQAIAALQAQTAAAAIAAQAATQQAQAQAAAAAAQANSPYGQAQSYVAALYQNYLGRAPTSSTEDAYWVNQIVTGAETADKIALDIRTSPEGLAHGG
jgi:hypothetical protein